MDICRFAKNNDYNQQKDNQEFGNTKKKILGKEQTLKKDKKFRRNSFL